MIADLLKEETTTNCAPVCCTERNRKAAAAYLCQLAEAVLRDDVSSFDLQWACSDGALQATVDSRFG
jgi:hypothetical protein